MIKTPSPVRIGLKFIAGMMTAVATLGLGHVGANAQIALPGEIEQQSLAADAFATGLLGVNENPLPTDLWQGTDGAVIEYLLEQMPTRPVLPVIGQAMRKTLLSGGAGPVDELGNRYNGLGGKKLLALVSAGFVEEARTIASLSTAGQNDPETGQALALADLLDGKNNEACARGTALANSVNTGRDARSEPFWVKLRTFCFALNGERDAADLTLSLLRERGSLDVREEEYLNAMVTSVATKALLTPQTAFELAVVKSLELPVSRNVLQEAQGAVVVTIARDGAQETATRIVAARRAVAMGLMSVSEYKDILRAIPLTPETLSRAGDIVVRQAEDPISDAVGFQAVSAMTSSEFLRDKALLLAQILKSAKPGSGVSFERSYALNILYTDDIKALEGALVQADHAALFARSLMAAGDGVGAGRWLFAMKGDGDILSLGDVLSAEFISLTQALALLDPSSAAVVADSANVSLQDSRDRKDVSGNLVQGQDAVRSARVAEALVDAALGRSEQGVGSKRKIGQAALAALALSKNGILDNDPLRAVLIDQSWRVAGLDNIRRQVAFQSDWYASSAIISSLPKRAEPKVEEQIDDGRTPSLKPQRRNR